MADKAIGINASLYQSHIDKINTFTKNNNLKTMSAGLQNIIDNYFKDNTKNIKGLLLFYLGYPIILCIVFIFASISTQKLMEILVIKGFYFNELYVLNRVFNIIGFGSLGFLFANIYLLRKKLEE